MQHALPFMQPEGVPVEYNEMTSNKELQGGGVNENAAAEAEEFIRSSLANVQES